jgi:hypothetical protein
MNAALSEAFVDGQYTVLRGTLDEPSWNDVVMAFEDASINQTWSAGAVRSGIRKLRHVLVRKGDDLVAAAQVRVSGMPRLRTGIAYCSSGPMCHARGRPRDARAFRLAIRGMGKLFTGAGLMCAMVGPRVSEEDPEITSALEAEGLRPSDCLRYHRHQTIFVDLTRSLDEIRKAAKRTWRQNLRKAEKAGLEIRQGTSIELFDAVAGMYESVKERKSTIEPVVPVNVPEFRSIGLGLPENQKLVVTLCRLKGEPVAGVVFAPIGAAPEAVVAAASPRGRETRGGYLAWWETIRRARELGATSLDLGGVPRADHAGSFEQFKRAMAGPSGVFTRLIARHCRRGSVFSRASLRLAGRFWRR